MAEENASTIALQTSMSMSCKEENRECYKWVSHKSLSWWRIAAMRRVKGSMPSMGRAMSGGPGDDAPVDSVHEGLIDVTLNEEAQGDNEPSHSKRERRGVPPLRLIEMHLAAAAEEKVKQSSRSEEEALYSSQRDKWQEGMDSGMNSLKENGVYELVDRPKGKRC